MRGIKGFVRYVAAFVIGTFGVFLIVGGLAAYDREMAAAVVINVAVGAALIYFARRLVRPKE